MARFRASQGGVTARFGAAQARIVRDLVSQVAELLGADPETARTTPARTRRRSRTVLALLMARCWKPRSG